METKTAHVSQKQSLMGNGQESTLHRGHLLASEQKQPRIRHMQEHFGANSDSAQYIFTALPINICKKKKKFQ